MPLPESEPRVRILKTSFVIYEHADFEKARQFLHNFGLSEVEHKNGNENEIFFKGYGPDPFVYIARRSTTGKSTFGGAAYLVESQQELEKATKIAGASQITPLDAPGGGEMVTLKDPSGHPVHLIFGQESKPVEEMNLQELVINFEDSKPRKGKFQRFKPGPAPVHKFGHYGVTYPEGTYQTMFDWYSKHLALTPSDIVYKDGKPMTAFFHIDRDEDYTDHHAFFFKPTKPGLQPHVAHAAFEVHDFDIQQLGHDHLAKQGYELCWGVGRHVLGSQVFDYWFDTSGFMVEHYADGDLVNCRTPVSHEVAGPYTLAIWGPPVPPVF